VKQSQGITLRFNDQGSGAFSQDTFTVSKSGAPNTQTIVVTGSWSNVEWRVDNQVRETGNSFTVNAANYTVGGHTLRVTVIQGVIPWTKTLVFTVAN
jgi:hypothetical protein